MTSSILLHKAREGGRYKSVSSAFSVKEHHIQKNGRTKPKTMPVDNVLCRREDR